MTTAEKLQHLSAAELETYKTGFYHNDLVGFMSLDFVSAAGEEITLSFAMHPSMQKDPILNASVTTNRNSETKQISFEELIIFTDVAKANAPESFLTKQLQEEAEAIARKEINAATDSLPLALQTLELLIGQ